MLEKVTAGKPFYLKDEAAYEKDKAVKTVIASADGAQMLIVALDHASLPDHPAPQDALLTVLDGEGDLVYQGQSVKLHHGTSVKMDKGAVHSVTTDKKLKFLLVLM